MLPPERAPAEALDHAALGRLRTDVGDDEALRRIVTLFVEGLEEARAELTRAVASGDDDGVRRVAHRLRSSGATFGAQQLAELARELEASASAGARDLIERVERESRRVGDAVARLRL
jgi:two-component system phosphorelay protein LuxU